MNELDKRLDKIEQQLNIISSNQSPLLGNPILSRSDEIDLRELFAIIWQGKWWIIGVTFLFALAGVVYAKSLPNMYKSEGVYAPAQKQSGSSLGGQLGGLASLAGVSLGSAESNDIDQAMVLLESWPFIESVIENFELKPVLLALRGWDSEGGSLVWDGSLYDPVSKTWSLDFTNGAETPSSYKAYRAFKEILHTSHDVKTGMVQISVESYSPDVSLLLVNVLVKELNAHFKKRDMVESRRNIEYLNDKISQTSIAEMQSVFYGMVEAQMKTLMLAEVEEEYLLKEVVSPRAAEVKSKPNRPLITVAFAMLGGVLISIFLMGRFFARL